MQASERTQHTVEDIYALPDGQRAELIDGEICMMTPPNRIHQELSHQLAVAMEIHVKSNQGECKVYPAPFAVFLNADNSTYVEPDISVICDKSKLDDRGCNGAPDWIIEVVSPSSKGRDYVTKLYQYRTAGVREYWIVNPVKQTVHTYFFEGEEEYEQYSFDEEIPVRIWDNWTINIAALLR